MRLAIPIAALLSLAPCPLSLVRAQAPPAAFVFYTPRNIIALIGLPQPPGPESFALCNLSGGPILARAEWTANGQPFAHEAYLAERDHCSIRELAPDELPDRSPRVTWRRITLGPLEELRPL